ncbi:MAG: tetratricopeptide repeat protein [Chloroflexota bacterium]
MAKSKSKRKSAKGHSPDIRQRASAVCEHWLEAIRLSEAGKPLQAIKKMEKVIALEPLLPGPRYDLGLIYDDTGRFSKAIQNYEAEITINPRHADAHHNLGCIYASRREFERARELFRRALELNPGHASAKANLENLEQAAAGSDPGQSPTASKDAEGVRLCVCMIVKNEEEHIGPCLESVKALVDEMVVVDTGSTDDTVAIAESHGAKVYHFPWQNDFALARNESLKHATGDWILILDADERLDEANGEKLRQLVQDPEYKAYFLELRSKEGIRDTGTVLAHLYARLFRNREGVRFEGAIHEQVFPSLYRLGIEVGYSDIAIEHLGYARDEVQMRAKGERNLAILQKQAEQFPNSSFVHFNLGKTYMVMEQHEDALRELRLALALPGPGYHIVANAHYSIGGILFEQGDIDGAIEECRQALSYGDDVIGPRLLLGNAYFKQGKFAEAVAEFERALSIHAKRGESKLKLDHDINVPSVKVSLGICLFRNGRSEDAIDILEEAVASGATGALVYRGLGDACFSTGNQEKALSAYERWQELETSPKDKAVAFLNSGSIRARLGALTKSEEYFRQALEHDAGLKAARQGLVSVLIQQGKHQEAKAEILGSLDAAYDDLALLKELEKVCWASGDLRGLVLAYEREMELGENQAHVSFRLASVLKQLGDVEGARSCLKKAVALEPSFAEAWHELGISYAQSRRFKEAEDCINQALRISPHSPKMLNSMGIVQIGLERYAEAQDYFNMTLELAPSDETASRNLQALAKLRMAHTAQLS